MDVMTILMMDTPKWNAFAFCVSDGLKNIIEQRTGNQKDFKLPSFFQYFFFIFFFAGFMLDPCFDYYDFDQFINEDKEYKNIPQTIMETLRLLRNAIIFMGIFLFTEKYLTLPQMSLEHTMFYIKPLVQQYDRNPKNQILWKMTIRRNEYSFLQYTYQGDGKFEKIKAIDVDWDLTYNMKDKVEKWNISIQTWLRRYVYTRFYSEEEMKKSASKQNLAYQMTYVVPSLWYGFYIGCYFQWAIMNNVNKAIFRVSCNTSYFNILETNPIGKIVRWYVANTVFNVFGITFLLLSVDPILNSIVILGMFLTFCYMPHMLSSQSLISVRRVKNKRMKEYILQKDINVKQLFGYLCLFHKDKQIKFNLQVKYKQYLLIFIEIPRFVLVLRQYQVKTVQQFQMTFFLIFDLYYSIEFELAFLKLDAAHQEHKGSQLYHEKMVLQEEGMKQRCHSLCISVFKYGSPQLIQYNNEILI